MTSTTTTERPEHPPAAGAQMDPRLRERRVAVRREQGRRRLRALLGVVVAALVVLAVVLAFDSPLLDVDHVEVRGTRRTEGEAVLAAARVQTGERMISIDVGAVAARVERLPWVADASVHRGWPGTVRIVVRERDPAAFTARDDGGYALLDAEGRVLGDVPDRPRDLLEVTGVRRVPAVGEVLYPQGAADVVHRFPDALARRVGRVDVAHGVSLVLTDGGEVRLGSLDDLEAKVAAATAVLDRLGDVPFDYVDVSVASNPSACCDPETLGGALPSLAAPVDPGRSERGALTTGR